VLGRTSKNEQISRFCVWLILHVILSPMTVLLCLFAAAATCHIELSGDL
jgi:membrane protein YqaA with SNARE-associated domain